MIAHSPYIRPWITQFAASDQKHAAKMIDCLEFVSTEKMRREIDDQVSDIIKNHSKSIIIPARELIDSKEVYFPQNKEDLLVYRKIELSSTVKQLDQFHPLLLHPTELHGSEAIISQLITELKRKNTKKVILNNGKRSASLNDIRKEKCDCMIIIDDIVASGTRAAKFLRSIFRNKTINSWVSGNILKVYFVSYMSPAALKSSKFEIKQKVEFNSIREMPTFCDIEPEERVEIERICKKYSSRNERFPLGYKNSFARIVFEHSVPNNTPPILWRSSPSWTPLFPERSVPNMIKIESSSLSEAPKPSRMAFMLALAALESETQISSPKILARHLNWETGAARDILTRLQKNLFIDDRNKITSLGKQELIYLRARKIPIEFTTSYYYPP